MTQPELQFEPKRETQAARILAELQKGRALTKWIVIHELGCLNVGERIRELRKGKYDGVCYPIQMEKIEVPNSRAKVARYFLLNEDKDTQLSIVCGSAETVAVS